MNCVYPHCTGTLRTGSTDGFCTLCRLPVNVCAVCGAPNRAFALFCRQCGGGRPSGRTDDGVDLDALRGEPCRTSVPQQVPTLPQVAAGFLWAMGEGGDLYRLNPHARSGEAIDAHDRFWAGAQPHAFHVCRLRAPFGPVPNHASSPARQGAQLPHAEDCAVVATAGSVSVSGLFSKKRRRLLPAEGECFLANARDEYQFVVAHDRSVFILSRHAEEIAFCCIDLQSSESLESGECQRFAMAHETGAVCGPVLLTEGHAAYPVIWSSTGLWVYAKGELTPVALPEAVELPTAPMEGSLRVPPGRSPAIAGDRQLFLAARQFGRPSLLRLTHGLEGWSTTAIAVIDGGTLGESSDGVPLLSTAGKLLACNGSAFRMAVPDPQIATRFPAWANAGLALFFCEADYRGLKQWIKAYREGVEIPVAWNLPPLAEVHTCAGFQTTGTALSTLCVLADKGLRTEFFSWCA